MGVEQVDGIARAVHRAASELEGTSPQLASIVHDAAGTIDNIARSLRESGPSDMVQGVTDFARRTRWRSSAPRCSRASRLRASPAPPPPARSTPMATTSRYGTGVRRGRPEYSGYADPAYWRHRLRHAGRDYVSGASGSFSGDRTGVSGADMGHGVTGSSGTASSQGASYGGAASGGVATGTGAATGSAHETSSGAPGWVAGDDGTARPATLASASLGGAAARKTPGQGQFDRDESAGSKS
jgi:hypothetical protein